VKILVNCTFPFALAHGGMAIQIQQTMAALSGIGLTVEPMRWWDETQTGDLIHYFGHMPADHILFAQQKGIAIIMANLFTVTCNRQDSELRRRGLAVKTMSRLPFFGKKIYQGLGLNSFAMCDCNVVGLKAEQRVLELTYNVPSNKVAIVPLGLKNIFLKAGPSDRSGDYLVCAGTITQRKNCIPLAQIARAAQVPILFVGKPYSEKDPYWLEFSQLIDGRWVRYQPHVADPAGMVALLQRARGAVVMSQYENWCFTAHEAAACGLPVLLPPMRWAHERFGDQACYFADVTFNRNNIQILKQFYEATPQLPIPTIKLHSWQEVALQLKAVYAQILK
jgi:glycosyltransferase involved in cell wall biosynthesis